MGLLGDGWDDPKSMATLQLAAGLLGGGNFGQALGRGLHGYQNSLQAAQEIQRQKMLDQLAQEQVQWKRDDRAKDAASEETLRDAINRMDPRFIGMNGPTADFKPRSVDPFTQSMYEMAKADPSKFGAPFLAAMKPKEAEYKVVGNSLVKIGDGNVSEAYSADANDPNKPFMLVDGQVVPNTAFQDFDLRRAAASAAKTSVAVNTADPTALARAGMDLQDKYRAATKDSFTRSSAYNAMMEASKAPSAKGDITMVYSFIKALDPTSAVREGEIDLVNANRSIPDKVKGYANRLASGQALLPHERADLIQQAKNLSYTDYKRSRNDLQAYRENAKRLTLDPGLYVPDPYEGADFSGMGQPVVEAPKVATMADIAETARNSGKSTAEVTAALRAKGFTIQGVK